jgi:hypothetical protein
MEGRWKAVEFSFIHLLDITRSSAKNATIGPLAAEESSSSIPASGPIL